MDLFDDIGAETPFNIPDGEEYRTDWIDAINGFKISVPHGELVYSDSFFDKKTSDRYVEYFQENKEYDWKNTSWKELPEHDLAKVEFTNISWKQDNIKLYGKVIPLPRLTSWYGDFGKAYTYSGIKSIPNEWNDGLSFLKEKIENYAGVEFNSVLLNWYRDGEDYINWHSDDERELGSNPIVASANFGETRDFVVRRKDAKNEKIVIPMTHGSFLLMRGEFQHHWEHSVPKRKKVKGSRFNLTFRRIGLIDT